MGRYGSGCGFFRPCQPPHIQRQLGNPVAAKGVENMTSLIDCPATRHFTEVLTHTTEVCLLSKEIVSVLFCCCLRSMTRPLTTGTGMDSHCRIKIWRTASNLQTSNTLFKGLVGLEEERATEVAEALLSAPTPSEVKMPSWYSSRANFPDRMAVFTMALICSNGLKVPQKSTTQAHTHACTHTHARMHTHTHTHTHTHRPCRFAGQDCSPQFAQLSRLFLYAMNA